MPYTAAQLGHRDGRFTLSVYAHAFKHRSKLTGAEARHTTRRFLSAI
jgi:hypothetical protein